MVTRSPTDSRQSNLGLGRFRVLQGIFFHTGSIRLRRLRAYRLWHVWGLWGLQGLEFIRFRVYGVKSLYGL